MSLAWRTILTSYIKSFQLGSVPPIQFLSFLFRVVCFSNGWYLTYLGMEKTRKAIHVGHLPYNNGSAVEKHLVGDIMDTVRPWVEELLDSDIRILFYSGQLDVIVGAPLT